MRPEASLLVQGKYLLERPLAQGGMGQVWVARHVELEVPVAVKFLDAKLVEDEEFVRRFQREARATAKLQSAHVARIFDYGVEGGTPFIVMELLNGENLADHMMREGKMPVARIAQMMAQIAKGLGEAHAMGIVHRDLKPSNIFLAQVAGEEVVKIIDFGIAKEVGRVDEGTTTASGVLMGSPRYISPEQARGAELDHRSDVWSLGVVVFEALLHRPLFETAHHGDLIAAITGDPLPIPTEIDPLLPAAIDEFMERALARQRRVRYQSVEELADALAAIAGEPLPKARPSLPPPPRADAAGRSTPTVAVGRKRAVSEPVDDGLAATIPRAPRRTRLAWLAAGVGIALLGIVVMFSIDGESGSSSERPATSAAPPASEAFAPVAPANEAAVSATFAETTSAPVASTTAAPSKQAPVRTAKPPPKGDTIDPEFGVKVSR